MAKALKRILSTMLIFAMLLTSVVFGATDEGGDLLAELTWASDFEQGQWNNTEVPAFFVSDFEPGSEVVRYFRIENNGELAFSYNIKMLATQIGELENVIDVYYKKDITQDTTVVEMTRLGTLAEVLGGLTIADGSIVPEGESASTAYTKETVVAVALKMPNNVPVEFMNKETGEFSIQLNLTSFDAANKFKVKFKNTDKYLYRVGNANTVALGSLFEEVDGAEIGNVNVSIKAIDENSKVSGTYTANASDWKSGTIKFSGTGPVEVTIDDDRYTNELSLRLEVVDAKNVTKYSELKEQNNVLLNDVIMTDDSFSIQGKALYGNGYTFDVTGGGISGSGYVTNNYLIYLNNGTLDNVKIVGKVYTQYGAQASSDYNRPVVLSAGNSTIANSYISNCAAPIRVNGGNLEVINTTLKGGNFANVDIRSGNVVLDNVTTINQVNGNDLSSDGKVVAGFGIVVFYQNVPSGTTVTVRNGITQYNNLSKAQAEEYIMDTSARQLTSTMFGNSCKGIQYTDANGDIWVNAGILSMTAVVGDANISDIPGYTHVSPTFMGIEGFVYSKVPTAESTSVVVPEYIATEQYTIAPDCVIEYPTASGKKNYLAKTEGSYDYCVYEESMVTISMDAGDSFQWDTDILTVTKAGKRLDYTVTMNGIDYTEKKINFDAAGNYTLTYTYTDDNNYILDSNGGITSFEKVYTETITIDVKVVEAAWKDAVIVMDSSQADVSKKNHSYVKTGDYDYQYKLKFLSCITVTDYDKNGNASVVDLDSNIASCETRAINGKDVNLGEGTPFTISLTYNDGRSLKVRLDWIGSTPGTKTCTVNIANDNVYIISDGASDACNTDVNWSVSDVTFTGNSGAAVNNNSKVTYYWNTSTDGYNSRSSGCVTGDTLVTLADGNKKAIKDVTFEDELKVWDFYEGEYASVTAAIISNHGESERNVITLKFDDGTVVNVVDIHQFFDIEANKLVTIDTTTVAGLVGHNFVKRDGNSYKTVKLSGYKIEYKNTDSYGIVSALHYNILVEDMFSADYPESVYDLMTYFRVGENMIYDKAAMDSDIEEYGLYTYEDFSAYMTRKDFDAMNIQYMKIPVEKGLYTFEGILVLIERWLAGYDDVVPGNQEYDGTDTGETGEEGGSIPEGSVIDPGIAPISDEDEEEPVVIVSEPKTLTITIAGNKISTVGYAVSASGEGVEASEDGYLIKTDNCDVILTAFGAKTGYAKITVDGDTYYTNHLQAGDSFAFTIKNATGKIVNVEGFWGDSDDTIPDVFSLENGSVIDCGTFSIKSVEGTTVVLANTTKYLSEEVDIYVAVYDLLNRLVDVRMEKSISVNGKDEHTFNSELVIPEQGYAKAFIWHIDNTLTPFFNIK